MYNHVLKIIKKEKNRRPGTFSIHRLLIGFLERLSYDTLIKQNKQH